MVAVASGLVLAVLLSGCAERLEEELAGVGLGNVDDRTVGRMVRAPGGLLGTMDERHTHLHVPVAGVSKGVVLQARVEYDDGTVVRCVGEQPPLSGVGVEVVFLGCDRTLPDDPSAVVTITGRPILHFGP